MWCRLNFIITVLIIISDVIFCEDAVDEKNSSEDSTREIREFDQFGWRAVGTLQESDLGWIPRGENRSPDQLRPKRRRFRKRKRRPPMTDNTDEEVPFVRRRIRPYRLDPWEEMNEEDIKPIVRRRKPQRFQSSEEINEEQIKEKPIENTEPSTTHNPLLDLKNLLKEPEVKLSLTETISELLKENEKKLPTNVPTIESITEITTKYKRVPPSVAVTKDNKNVVQDYNLSEKETMEAQRKRLSILQPKIYSNAFKYDVINEPTTERRIFIPTNTKYEEKVDKLDIETTTELKSTVQPSTAPMKRLKLPTTNAKLRTTATKKMVEKILPEPVKIKISEVTGFIESTTKKYTNEGPMRISIDLETIFQNGSIPYIVETNPEQNESYVTAKEELMEVMEDPISREKLSKVLENRNMTLEELVEQRERGSSQLHLADIFHNNTREPEPIEEPHVGLIKPDFLIKSTNRQQKSTKFEQSTTVSSTIETIDVKQETFPWKQLYPNLFPESNDVKEILERIENDDNYSLNSRDDGFFLNIPTGMKSALYVSLAIIGLSIMVFLAILVVFKLVQKNTKSLRYSSSLSTRFKSPMIIQGRPTTAIKTFMNETLGRKKNYFKTSLQSMSDDIWDTTKERKESF